jgi:hypothetical protein
MSEPSSPRDWQTLYAAAMLEGDSTQFQPHRIQRAEEAIKARMRELPQKFFVGPEHAELRSALQNLRLLKSARPMS